MNDHDDRLSVYEIGYLIAGSTAEEHVPVESDKVKKIIIDSGAEIIAEEMPHRERLAYTMRRKTVSGTYEKYNEGFFGWVKFEVGSSKVEAIKKAVELIPSLLRMILITAVRENTYLGKRAPAMIARTVVPPSEDKVVPAVVPPASIEDMDKSIDDMVKEV